jgi:hypothetical protein
MKTVILILTLSVLKIVNGDLFDDKVPDYVLDVGKIFQTANSGFPASYLNNLELGYAMAANDNYMVLGGGRTDVYGCIGVFKWNATANGYNELVYSHLSGQYLGAAVSIAKDANHMTIYRDGSGNLASAYRVTGEFSSASAKNLATESTSCNANYPCRPVAMSHDGNSHIAGWPNVLEGAGTGGQRGFVRYYGSCGATSCSPRQNAWWDGLTSGGAYHGHRGKDQSSYAGQYISAAVDYTDTYPLYAVGAPGNTEQDNSAGYPTYDLGGNNGDWRYGGYVQVNLVVGNVPRVLERIWAPDGDTAAAANNEFGACVHLSSDGKFLLVTATGYDDGGGEKGAFYVYENLQNGPLGQDGFKNNLVSGPIAGPVNDEKFGWSCYISTDGVRVFIGAPEAGTGDGKVYSYTYGDGTYNLQGDFLDETSGNAGKLGTNIYYREVDNKLYAGVPFSESYGVYNNVGKVVGYDVPPPPTPAPTLSPTPPTPAPTQSPTVSPTIVVGKTQIKYNVKSGTGRQNIAKNTITDVKSKYTKPENLEVRVKSTETSTTPLSVYNDIGNKTLYEESYAKARGCWPDCTATAIEDRRLLTEEHWERHGRELQSGGNIVVEITFDLTETAYDNLIASGNNLDDPDFLTDLATELGVSPDNITVTVTGGEVVVEVSLLAQVTDEPSGEDTLADLQEIQNSLNNATQVLVTELNEPGSSVTTVELDLCGSRDCSGFGDSSAPDTDANGCNPNTGVCVCTNDRWGINCESECQCNNGGYCANGLCHCDYPYYGLRCDNTKLCNCTI